MIKERGPLTEKIIACAYKVHSKLGPGFTESIYHNAFKIALEEKGLKYQTEKSFDILFQDKNIGRFRLDLVIEDKVVTAVLDFVGDAPQFDDITLMFLARDQ